MPTSRTILLQLFAFTIFVSCSKDAKIEKHDVGYSYFPLFIGKTTTYHIDSINYNDFTGKVDTFSWELKEVLDSTFFDRENRLVFPVQRFIKEKTSNTWTIKDVWQAIRTNTYSERTEENFPYIKLTFPVKSSTNWNYNARNTKNKIECKYESIDKNYTINNNEYDSTVLVIHQDEETLISKDYSIEVYARNIGLIYKKDVHLEMLLSGTIKKGYDYTQTIKYYE